MANFGGSVLLVKNISVVADIQLVEYNVFNFVVTYLKYTFWHKKPSTYTYIHDTILTEMSFHNMIFRVHGSDQW